MTYDGLERRHPDSGRRDGDRDFCAVHHILQDERKDHRELVCGKISSLKADYIRDVGEVKYNMEELKDDIKNKADAATLNAKANVHDLKGVMKFVAVMISICGIIIAGQALWLKSDISNIASSIQRLNMRITETVNDRMASDIEQIKKLSIIEGEMSKMNWRMEQMELSHKDKGK